MRRRAFLTALLAAPAIVRVASIMPVRKPPLIGNVEAQRTNFAAASFYGMQAEYDIRGERLLLSWFQRGPATPSADLSIGGPVPADLRGWTRHVRALGEAEAQRVLAARSPAEYADLLA